MDYTRIFQILLTLLMHIFDTYGVTEEFEALGFDIKKLLAPKEDVE